MEMVTKDLELPPLVAPGWPLPVRFWFFNFLSITKFLELPSAINSGWIKETLMTSPRSLPEYEEVNTFELFKFSVPSEMIVCMSLGLAVSTSPTATRFLPLARYQLIPAFFTDSMT